MTHTVQLTVEQSTTVNIPAGKNVEVTLHWKRIWRSVSRRLV
jgi:hypothetical protein